MGNRVLGRQGDQRTVTLGLSERLQLLAACDPDVLAGSWGQAPAQALGGLLPGVRLEELAHGVCCEVVLGEEE